MSSGPFIVVSGNIGVGKTTVVERLADELGLEPYFEPHAENPFLEGFYQDMNRWAFHSQLFFLVREINHHRRIIDRGIGAIQDRSIYEHFQVFASQLHANGHLSEHEFQLLAELYNSAEELLRAPDLMIYLKAPIPQLQERIAARNRLAEHSIDASYLAALQQAYDRFIDAWYYSDLMVIDTTEHDVRSEAGLDRLAVMVSDRLAQHVAP